MRNLLASILLVSCLGMTYPAQIVARSDAPDSHLLTDDPASRPAETPHVGLAACDVLLAVLKSTGTAISALRDGLVIDPDSEAVVDSPRNPSNCLTLQSQHVLLRI